MSHVNKDYVGNIYDYIE